MHGKLTILGALAALATGLAFVAGASHAQYPPPAGSVEIQSSSTVTDPGDEVLLTCIVEDEDGSPLASVACTFTIVSEPGDDAAVGSKTVTKLTNSQGIATTTLFVGSTPGLVIVEAEAEGLTSNVLVTVEGETQVASPPQAPIGGITPPSTGSGGLVN